MGYAQRPVNGERRQGVEPGGVFYTTGLQRRYERVIHLLSQESQRYFDEPVPPVFSPVLVIHRRGSDLIKCHVQSARQSFCLYIKFCLQEEQDGRAQERKIQRMWKDVEVTSRLYQICHRSSKWSVPRIVAFFPQDMAIVMEESRGERLLDLISGFAPGYPRRKTLDELGIYCHSAGQWLREFQRTSIPDVGAPRTPVDLVYYVELRLMKLMRLQMLREDECKHILQYLEGRLAEASDIGTATYPVHGDFSLSNILVSPDRVTVLDFAMYHVGSIFADVSYFYQRLQNFHTHPFFRDSTITLLEGAFIEGYDSKFDCEHPMFRAYRVQYIVNRLVDLARTNDLALIKRFYQRWQYKECLSGLKHLMQMP